MKKYCLSILLILFTIMAGLFGLSGTVENTAIRVQNFDLNDIYRGENDSTYHDVDTMSHIDSVYLGGIPLGIDVKSRELIITSKQEVITDNGVVMPLRGIDIKNGDRLVAIDGVKVYNDKDIYNILKDRDSVSLTIERGGELKIYTVKPAIDSLTHRKRLGLWLKDGITGIGTLTYIRPDRRYGALGHPIEENRTYNGGRIYSANINDYIPGERGKAGELCGSYVPTSVIGSIDKNTNYGIFGTYIGDLSTFKRVKVANRNEVKQGHAEIYTTINGSAPKCYDIEIIKRNIQSRPDIKGMVIRIVDEELLQKTHGILQGMSGSPIIQNGKLIGAVTHVFINDPTKGFGVYSDFMLGN